jgi:hypothetical protein
MAVGQKGPCPSSYWGQLSFDWSAVLEQITPEIVCLGGSTRMLAAAAVAGSKVVRWLCEASPDSPLGALCQYAQELIDSHSWLKGAVGYALKEVGSGLRETLCLATALSDNFAQAALGGRAEPGTDADIFIAATFLDWILGIWERWIGKPPMWIKGTIEELQNFFMPYHLPSGPEANALLATGLIPEGTWNCLVRAHGLVPRWQRRLVKMAQGRPRAHELLLLRRLYTTQLRDEEAKTEGKDPQKIKELQKKLKDIETLFKRDGFTDPQYLKYWQEAQRWFPSPTDAIEWMLKDTEDKTIQDTFALGAEFYQKYAGVVRDAFDWNGVPEELANRIWRAHWRNMDPHALYEMHKRLRPGWTNLMSDQDVASYVMSIAPVKTPQVTLQSLQQRPLVAGPPVDDLIAAGVPPAVAQRAAGQWPVPTYRDELVDPLTQRAWLESLGTTAFHISDALGQADYPAFWRQRLMAISYSPMTRVDMRRAYETDNISFARLVAGLQDRGYAPADALSLARFYESATLQTLARRPIVAQWVRSGFSTQLLREALKQSGSRADLIDGVMKIAETRRKIHVQQECLAAIKRGFISHFLDEATARQKLVKLGFGAQEQNKFIEEWTCVRDSKSKVESASMICTAFKVGLIAARDAVKALGQLGYNRVQARRILAICGIRQLPKTIKPELLPQVLQQLAQAGA